MIDSAATLEVIERLRLARIGDYTRWKRMAKRLRDGGELGEEDAAYFARMTSIYRDAAPRGRGRQYHTKLSELDPKPRCCECGGESLYYCNLNDVYLCEAHVVGHDENES